MTLACGHTLMATTLLVPLGWSKWTIAGVAIFGYLCLVRALRWRRYNAMHAKYGHKMDTLTLQEAQNIIQEATFWDMPLVNGHAMSFALFKTYAIPTISALLEKTKQLSSEDMVSKRCADTDILMTTVLACPMTGSFDLDEKPEKEEIDPRAMIALARVNWIHAKYKISNDDYLYTLCLFIFEPQIWAEKFAWRALSPLECQALYIYWVEVGTRLGIKNIPDTFAKLKAWSLQYQEEYMVPAQTNNNVAIHTVNEVVHAIPEAFGMKAFMKRVIFCTVEEPVRVAMMLPAQPRWMHVTINTVIQAVKYTQRYLLLPRWSPHLSVDVSLHKTAPGTLPRMRPTLWRAKPWYKPIGSFGGIFDRIAVMLGQYDDVPGPAYKSEGYRLEELGPPAFEKSGHEEVMRKAGEMLGCPVRGPWSLDGGK